MLTQDAADSSLARHEIHPIEELNHDEHPADETPDQMIERLSRAAYREAARKQIAFVHSLLAYILASRSLAEREIRVWVVASALGHPVCNGMSDTAIAAIVGTSRANFCKKKIGFQRQNNLPSTDNQRSPKARAAYREARLAQLETPADHE